MAKLTSEEYQAAFKQCIAFLYSIPDTIDARDVRNSEEYQDQSVDLQWIRSAGKEKERTSELIKVCFSPEPAPDRYFFEILDGNDKRKPGWFSSSKADLLFYYFLDLGELHILLIREFKPWLVKNMKNFQVQPCPSNDILPVPMGLGCTVRQFDLPASLQESIVQVDMRDFE
ncbi:MAG: hypothetical protein MAGBODY4_00612 [Candidatus Marinimicrobia bacterium]|nr:hypothetical protein [Candidatus Neomarinimicrobiota bacterium]